MNTLSIIATFKNESTILNEWLHHYASQGVDHFYLIDDYSTDDYLPSLRPFNNRITLFKPTKPYNRINNYNNVFKQIKSMVKWLIVCDLTQYWFTPNGTVRDYLEKTNADVITSTCYLLGDPSITYQPKSIRKTFIGVQGVSMVKSIAKASVIESIGVSQHLLKSGAIAKLDNNGIAVNDYHYMSLEYFYNVRMRRSHPDNPNVALNWGDFLLASSDKSDTMLRDICIQQENK